MELVQLANQPSAEESAGQFARNIGGLFENHWIVPGARYALGSETVWSEICNRPCPDRLGHAVMLDLHKASEPVKSVATATELKEITAYE